MKTKKLRNTIKILGSSIVLVVIFSTLLIFAQQKTNHSVEKEDSTKKDNKPMDSLELTNSFYNTSPPKTDKDEGNQVVAVRWINLLIDSTDADGSLIKKSKSMVEIELFTNTTAPITSLLNIIRIGDRELLPTDRACVDKANCISFELTPEEFTQLADNALITYRIGYPISSKDLKKLYKNGEPKEIEGTKFGRLNKKLIDKFPVEDRNVVQN